MFKLFFVLCAVCLLLAVPDAPVDAQNYRYVQPRYSAPPQYNRRNDAVGRGIEELYNQGQQYQQQQDWADQQRRQWEADQAYKQQWLQEQENRRYMQQQPQFVPPHANSTPMFYPPSGNYDQRRQDWQQQHQGRQQMLDQWGRALLPAW